MRLLLYLGATPGLVLQYFCFTLSTGFLAVMIVSLLRGEWLSGTIFNSIYLVIIVVVLAAYVGIQFLSLIQPKSKVFWVEISISSCILCIFSLITGPILSEGIHMATQSERFDFSGELTREAARRAAAGEIEFPLFFISIFTILYIATRLIAYFARNKLTL